MKFIATVFGLGLSALTIILNLVGLLYNATPIIRGELVGGELEWALVHISILPACGILFGSYLYNRVANWAFPPIEQEKKKCKCGNT